MADLLLFPINSTELEICPLTGNGRDFIVKAWGIGAVSARILQSARQEFLDFADLRNMTVEEN